MNQSPVEESAGESTSILRRGADDRSRQQRDRRYQDASAARQVLDSEQQVRDSRRQIRDAALLRDRQSGAAPSVWEIARLRAQEGRQTGQEFRQASQRLRIASQLRAQEKQGHDAALEVAQEAIRRVHECPTDIRSGFLPEARPDAGDLMAVGTQLDDQRRESGRQRQETERQQVEMQRQRADMQRQRAESRRQRQELL